MLKPTHPFYLANQPRQPNTSLEVKDKFNGTVAARVAQAESADLSEAIARAAEAAEPMRRLPAFRRAEVLEHCVRRLSQRSEELARILCIEAGKPIRDARGEVTRLIDTFKIALGESTRFGGEYAPLDLSPRAQGYVSLWKRVPVGVCGFITPFNFPLNLVAHKVAPALAVGCPFVLKPASYTPLGALLIAEILAETDLPRGAFSVLPMPGAAAQALATDDRVKLLSFTGSAEVGWALKAVSGRKKVSLELGGNAGCIVDEFLPVGMTWEHIADRITFGAFYQSGQSCISVQRIFIHQTHYDRLVPMLIERAQALKMGDPADEATSLGPLISEFDARRVEEWVAEAVEAGARLLCGGRRHGNFYEATYLENVDPRLKVSCREVFGPVATVQPFRDFSAALARVNDSEYGLQAGVFTGDLAHALAAWDDLEVGGVVIGDVPSFRVDSMPYGGVKASGLGREGVRFAMEEMSEIRLMVLRR